MNRKEKIGGGGFHQLAWIAAFSLVLSICAFPFAVRASAETYACGKMEHVHSATCRVDPVEQTLVENGLSGYGGTMYVVHQHTAACFGKDGILACPFAVDGVLDGHPNVRLIHVHDDSCDGCTLPETSYAVGEDGGAAGGSVMPEWSDPDVYVNGGIGGYKDTGDNTGALRPGLQYHVHGDGCGPDCVLPIVIEGVIPDSGAYSCGMEEHVHGPGCRPVPSVSRALSSLMSANAAADELQGSISSDRNTRVELMFTDRQGEDRNGMRVYSYPEYTSDLEGGTFGMSLQASVSRSVSAAAGEIELWIPTEIDTCAQTYRDMYPDTKNGVFCPDPKYFGSDWDYEKSEDGRFYIVRNKDDFVGGTHLTLYLAYGKPDGTKGTVFASDNTKTFWAGVSLREDGKSYDCALPFRVETVLDLVTGKSSPGGLKGAAKDSVVIAGWDPVLEKAFGLKEEDFDDGYFYDVVGVTAYNGKTQVGRVSVLFTPGAYPTSPDADPSSVYGWGSEVVGAAVQRSYVFSAFLSGFVPCGFSKSGRTPSDYAGSAALPAGAASIGWNSYEIEIPDAYRIPRPIQYLDNIHVLVLVRYPKTESITKGHVPYTEDAEISLTAKAEVTLSGVSDGVLSKTVSMTAFEGIPRDMVPPEVIYTDVGFANARLVRPEQTVGGFSSLLDRGHAQACCGFVATVMNQNREGYDEADPASYDLRVALDSFAVVADGKPYLLSEGDYVIKEVHVYVLDGDGYLAKSDTDSKWRPTWDGSATMPSDLFGKTLDVSYGEAGSPSWTPLSTQPGLGSVWNAGGENVNFSYNALGLSADTDSATKVMVSFPYARRLTRLYVWLDVELLSDGPTIGGILSSHPGLDSLDLVAWGVMSCYDSDGALDPECSDERVAAGLSAVLADGFTQTADPLTRALVDGRDASCPYDGYRDGQARPCRRSFKSVLDSVGDYAGMTIGRTLYDRGGKKLEDASVVDGMSKATYDVSAALFDGTIIDPHYSIDDRIVRDNAFAGAAELRESVRGDAASPFAFAGQRFFFLLPDGTEYVDGSLRALGDKAGVLSSNSMDGMPGEYGVRLSGNRVVSAVVDDALFRLYDVDVDCSRRVSGRQILFVTLVQKEYLMGDVGIGLRGLYGALSTYGVGASFSFDVVPSGGSSVSTGQYDMLCVSEFLDADGNPYSLSGFSGRHYTNLQDAFVNKAFAEYLGDSGAPDGYVAVSDAFVNFAGGGFTFARMQVDGGYSMQVEPDSDYTYTYTYGIGDGTSKDVVLFASIENDSLLGSASEWRGTMTGVTLDDPSARLYVNEGAIDVAAYESGGADASWLSEDRGWKPVSATELDTYDYSDVRCVAVSFAGKTFSPSSDVGSRTSFDVHMRSPSFVRDAFQQDRAAYCELAFHDHHSSSTAKTTVCNPVVVTMRLSGGDEMPKTGGAGIGGYIVTGIVLMAVAGCLATSWSVRRKDGDGRGA